MTVSCARICAVVILACALCLPASSVMQYRECKDSPSQCPSQCTCRENKVCFNEELWREGVEHCNTYFRCGDPQIADDQDGCAECLKKLSYAAEESCMDEFDPAEAKADL